ncbi:PRTRC system protein A [Ralstonia solanacearum]|uniref:PRTRC system protein A n=1 Tax=Ralstonia solanacearum TaxID=305 RepID=UPI0005C6DD70|nr:PRTRC system protein A [Ralstonia solanacearum]MBB6591172.1 PRTRC system protein A [Ralstonia solanacearum]MBB6595366.1 PRTRC system protein A [Ralstonia solanacearum]MDB0541378.1 PRTRC system protein A [Ralstonia solanacearum]MDB0550708.1 PRTRC system protein A [Ralstonia solanacearum]MDB0556327.1 PRTRC system protein A [Ralstonia solanacearum]
MQTIISQFHANSKQGLEIIAGALDAFAKAAADKVTQALRNPIAADPEAEQYELDAKLWDSAPTIAVPKFAEFKQLEEVGHRFLATAEGLFVEVRRPWLHVIQPVAPLNGQTVRPPYGTVKPKVELSFERLGAIFPMVRTFIEAARQAAPNEHAAWVIWDSHTGDLAYRELNITSASPGAIDYERPKLQDHESLVVDMHSHGALAAFFSEQDNHDDAGEVKISCVVGDLADGKTPSIQFRLCVLGMFLPLKVPAAAVLGTAS